ncbi:RING finger domain protein [Aspergillus clavatus NRRL 1]|uniref:RING-type E3 ubiquitin transferase n=1 Tax=Aspergillus clavatus (strain ATCC 1007 / CBS 513.65 / DSM 816 / NCTC 3887 / NRRL 1 / QM 1276 / 107) TaxID=344612 RepID=A1CK25_ASPCL|nr:RING finger domain protein [Aspergillus clavatus NRRL 1]EAW09499.1 RING finger domain protein [Aspergillus clavatus NRRL 1]
MSEDADLQQKILQKTLQEVAQEDDGDDVSNPCVICLEAVTEPAIAVPCTHANFDFLCLVSWLEQRRSCPLCKSDIHSVKYDLGTKDGPKIYQLPPLPPAAANALVPSHPHRPGRGVPHGPRNRRWRAERPRPQEPDDPISRRQHVYRHQLYSLRVGSNRLSQYRELTPELFNRDEELVSRARKWIRRELRVFAFLNPEAETEPGVDRVTRPGQQRLENRRGNNAEFLLEYIIAILRTVDIKGSAGQAEELLRDFLGRDNARLFLHELQAWLRSPYTSLEDWDRHVQYEDTAPGPSSGRTGLGSGTPDRTTTPVDRGGRSPFRGRVAKPRRPQGYHSGGSSRDDFAQARRLQFARQRYIPD